MAETVFAVIVLAALGVIGYVMWLMWKELRQIQSDSISARLENAATRQAFVPIETGVEHIREVLTEASRLKAQKVEPKPNSANISPVGRYVPIAKRRSVAEAESQGPVTHDAAVRENNAKAMETAG
jgi:hypothetical protein